MTSNPEKEPAYWSHPRGPDPLYEFRMIIESLDLHIKNVERDGPLGNPVAKQLHLITADMIKLQSIKKRLSPLLQQKIDKLYQAYEHMEVEGMESGRFFDNLAEMRKVIMEIHKEILEK